MRLAWGKTLQILADHLGRRKTARRAGRRYCGPRGPPGFTHTGHGNAGAVDAPTFPACPESAHRPQGSTRTTSDTTPREQTQRGTGRHKLDPADTGAGIVARPRFDCTQDAQRGRMIQQLCCCLGHKLKPPVGIEPRPYAYEAHALPAELRRHDAWRRQSP